MTIEKRDVMFKSGETFAAAWLFLPKVSGADAPVPGVAMAIELPTKVGTSRPKVGISWPITTGG